MSADWERKIWVPNGSPPVDFRTGTLGFGTSGLEDKMTESPTTAAKDCISSR